MKHCLTAILLGLVVWGCVPPPEDLKQTRAEGAVTYQQQVSLAHRRQEQYQVDAVASRMIYFKDPRTNLCFVSYEFGNSSGISLVPAEMIPKEMLYVAKVKIPPTAEKVLP